MNAKENCFNIKNGEAMRIFVDGVDGFDGNYQNVILTVGKLVQHFGFINVESLISGDKTNPIKRIFRIADTYDYDVFDFEKLNDTYSEINLHDVPYEWWGMIGYLYSKKCLPEDVQHLIRPRVKHSEKYNNMYGFNCDEKIYHLVNVFNDLGYGTRFSCEGNVYSVKDDLFSAGYIKFSDDINVDDILTQLADNGVNYSIKNNKIISDNIFAMDERKNSIKHNLSKQFILIDDGSYIGDFEGMEFLNDNLFNNGEKKLEDCKFLTHTIIALPYSILKLNDHTVRFGMGFNLNELANIIVS